MIKLIATDMDGTLLDGKHDLPKNFEETLEKVKNENIIMSVCTGRSYLDALSKVEEYKNDLMFICENGAFIYYKGEVIYSNTLSKETLKKIIEIGRKIDNVEVVLSGQNGLYVESQKAIKEIEKVFPGQFPMTLVDSLLEVDDDIYKVNIFDTINSEDNSYKEFKKHNIEGITIIPSGRYWLDIMNEGINKGIAIKKVQEIFNINYDETMTIGDYMNDLEMMKSAYYSFAMKNAHERIKEVARFETKLPNTENGAIETIDEFLFNNKKEGSFV